MWNMTGFPIGFLFVCCVFIGFSRVSSIVFLWGESQTTDTSLGMKPSSFSSRMFPRLLPNGLSSSKPSSKICGPTHSLDELTFPPGR